MIVTPDYNSPGSTREYSIAKDLIENKLSDGIDTLTVHKGQLEISWKKIPTRKQLSEIKQIWEGIYNECIIENTYRDQIFILDQYGSVYYKSKDNL